MTFRFLLLAGLLAVSARAAADATTVPVEGEGWSISFDAPPLESRSLVRGDDFVFQGAAGRFNISMFVEVPAREKGSHEDVYRYYWAKGSKNPLIAQETVRSEAKPAFHVVHYDVVLKQGDQTFRAVNANYYFAAHGRWMDVHVSVIEPSAEDLALLERFEASLAYD